MAGYFAWDMCRDTGAISGEGNAAMKVLRMRMLEAVVKTNPSRHPLGAIAAVAAKTNPSRQVTAPVVAAKTVVQGAVPVVLVKEVAARMIVHPRVTLPVGVANHDQRAPPLPWLWLVRMCNR